MKKTIVKIKNLIKSLFNRLRLSKGLFFVISALESKNRAETIKIILQISKKFVKKRLLFFAVFTSIIVFLLSNILFDKIFSSVSITKYVAGLLFLLFVFTVTHFLRPTWFKVATIFLKSSWQTMHTYSKEIFKKVVGYIKRFVKEFKYASNRDRWLMVSRPIYVLIALFFIWKFGFLFFPPKIVTSFPGNQSTEAPLDSKIEIIFDRGVIKSLAEKGFRISPNVNGNISWESDQKLIFTPQDKLNRATSYRVDFNGIVLSKFLIPLFGNQTTSFETIGNPKVILASPQVEALEDLTPITVVFDRQMITLTTSAKNSVQRPAFSISPEIKGEGRWLGTTAYQFRPSEPFIKATTYKVTVPAGMSSQDDGVLQNEYSWEFSSERPRIYDVSPKHDYDFASPVASVSATFNQNINLKSISDNFIVFDKDKKRVPGRVVVAGNIAGFYPNRPLKREERYMAVVSKEVYGTVGPNKLGVDYSWSFGVAAKPAVVRTNPANRDKNISKEYRVEVFFKSPMDEGSFENNIFIDPQPEFKPSMYFSSYNSLNSLSINTFLGRSKTYKITIGSGVKDQYGVPLGTPYTFSFSTDAYKPSVGVYPTGTYFGAFNQDVVPRIVAQVINANKVDYSLYELKREDLLDLYRRRYETQCGDDYSCRNWQNYDTSKLKKIRSWSENYEANLNTPVHVITKVTTDSGDKIPSGFYFLDMRIPQGPHDNMVMIVSKTALTIKKSDSQIFSWVVNQSKSNVVPNMKIQLTDSSGNILSEGVSNKEGVFMKDVDLFNKDNLFVFGQKDTDVVVAASAWSQGINNYDFGLPNHYNANEYKDYDTKQDYKLFLTVDRPIYRPGQIVYFKGVIKKDNDGAYENLQPGEKVKVNITDSQNRSIYSQDLPVTTFGSFSGNFILSKDANLGFYQVRSEFSKNFISQQFQVEEYKKQDLAVTVKLSKEAYSQGDNSEIAINASYYFGAPVRNAPVTWVLQTQDYSFRWDKDWRFEFGDPESYWSRPQWYYSGSSYFSGKKVTEGAGQTNAKGDLEFDIPLDISKQKTSQKMIVEATVNDVSNQSIAASQEFIVHKGGWYAGLRPVSYVNQYKKEAKIEVVAVDLKGDEISNAPVTIEFYKRTWETIREKNSDDGLFYYTSKPRDSLVDSTVVTTDSLGKAIASFIPMEGGTYKVVGRITDKKGNQNISGSFLWVSGYGFSTARENNDRIILVTDKRDYLVGEDMSVFVATPFGSDSAKTLLTVERGSVLDYKVVDTNESSNNFTLSIPPRYTPNAFIGAVLVRGGNEVKKPAEFKIGYSEIKVTDKKQQIDVQITTDKKKYKPKEKLKATIETKNLLGNPISAELSLGLVDKAVWDLSNVDLPDIYKTFYQPRNLEVSTYQLLTISIDRINANTNLGSKGGSGGGCFLGDTPILMSGGLYKNIKDIQIGDIVLTKESDMSSNLVEAKVINTFKHENVDQYIIINGTLRVTPVHKMYVNNNWITAGEIEIGDFLLDKNNLPIKVFSIERVYGNFVVYNLEIDKYRTYIAGDIYVHNQKGGNDTSRSNFPDTAYWNPTLKTNNDGKATVEIPLPDSLTTWRLAAIANSKEAAFGSKVSEVVVGRDVLIRPLLPRFLSAGDEAKLGAIVVNASGQEQTLIAKIESDELQISEAKSKEIVLADGAQAKVTWTTVTKNIPSAKIKLIVEGADKTAQDAAEITLPVNSYSVPMVTATSGLVNDTATEKIFLPKQIQRTKGSANLIFSPSLGGDSISALPYLFDYPYYSTEQITSKFLSAVFVNRILQSAKIEKSGSIEAKQLENVINDSIQRLNNQQQSDGGWGWWIESESNPFLTAYAYLALSEAKIDNFTVADQTLQRAQDYLENQLAFRGKELSLETQSYILYALKGRSSNLSAYASNFFDRRFELSLKGRAYLTIAMNELGMDNQAKKVYSEIISLAKKTATTTHWEEPTKNYIFMGSNTTTTASVLEAISKFDKNSPLISEVTRHLMNIRRDGHWSTTFDTASAIRAISFQLLKDSDQKVNQDYRLELNGKIIKEGKITKDDLFKLQEYIISISNFKIGDENNLRITKSGEGNLYYSLNLKYYLPFSETKPLEQGMVVVREFVDSKGNILPNNTINENSEVNVRLLVVAPEERHFVVIEDILPAGLESVNEALKNVSVLNKERPGLKEQGNQFLYFEHKEYRDDRTTLFSNYLPAGVYEISYRVRATTPGKYHYPPARAYQMYAPDVSGNSEGGWLEVKE
jgi:uncharacterized protein YfaS (alpha-2-macroglobulin family)